MLLTIFPEQQTGILGSILLKDKRCQPQILQRCPPLHDRYMAEIIRLYLLTDLIDRSVRRPTTASSIILLIPLPLRSDYRILYRSSQAGSVDLICCNRQTKGTFLRDSLRDLFLFPGWLNQTLAVCAYVFLCNLFVEGSVLRNYEYHVVLGQWRNADNPRRHNTAWVLCNQLLIIREADGCCKHVVNVELSESSRRSSSIHMDNVSDDRGHHFTVLPHSNDKSCDVDISTRSTYSNIRYALQPRLPSKLKIDIYGQKR